MLTKLEHIAYWVKSAEEDWQTSELLFQTKRYLHSLFFPHLCLEKWLKAHWVRSNEDSIPPKIHNLVKLAKSTDLRLEDEDLEFLRQFNDFQIEGRYPDYLFSIQKICTESYTAELLDKVKELISCLRSKMP